MSGGKGGEQEVKINKDVAAAAKQNYAMAQAVSKLGYQPNRGLTVAAFTPQQEAAMANQNTGLEAFGMGTVSPMAGMPQPQTNEQGIRGYSYGPTYDASVNALPESYRNYMQQFFIDPNAAPQAGGQNAVSEAYQTIFGEQYNTPDGTGMGTGGGYGGSGGSGR